MKGGAIMKKIIMLTIATLIIIGLLAAITFFLYQISEQLNVMSEDLKNIKSTLYWIKMH